MVLPLLQVCHHAIHLRLKLSAQASLLLHHLTHGTDKQAATLREALRSASKDDRETRLSKEMLYGEDALLVKSYAGKNNESEHQLVTRLLPERESESDLHSGSNSRAVTPFHSLSGAFTHANTNTNTGTDSSAASTQALGSASGAATSNPPHDRSDTNSSSSARHSSSSHSSSPSPVSTSTAEQETDGEPTWWQKCTLHNLTMSLLQGCAALKLVELSYTPTVVVEDSLVLSTTNSYALHAE